MDVIVKVWSNRYPHILSESLKWSLFLHGSLSELLFHVLDQIVGWKTDHDWLSCIDTVDYEPVIAVDFLHARDRGAVEKRQNEDS